MDATQGTGGEQTERWNGLAGNAWVDAQDVIDRMFAPFEKMLTEGVAPGSDAVVLDVGCGTGGTTVAIARRLGAMGRCVGIDISEAMTAAGRARAERERVAIDFICANAQAYPFEPARFDLIVSRFGVMFFDDPIQAFTNLRRSARHDARLQCIAWRSPAENPFMTTAERAAAPLLPNLPPRVADAPGQFGFADRRRVSTILEESGWAAIDIAPIDVECILPEPALVGYLTRFGLVGQVIGDVDDRTRAQVVETVRAAFDPYVHGAEVRFTAACWMIRATR